MISKGWRSKEVDVDRKDGSPPALQLPVSLHKPINIVVKNSANRIQVNGIT